MTGKQPIMFYYIMKHAYKQTSSKSFGGVAGMLFITAIDLNKYNISMDDINSSLEQYKITPNIQKIEQSNSSNGVKKIRI